jgi:hypothetical protein
MAGLFEYKHEKKKQFKPRKDTKPERKEFPRFVKTPATDLEDALKKHEKVTLKIRNDFNKSYLDGINPLFEGDMIRNAVVLQEFVQNLAPEIPDYVYENPDGTYKISLRALMDARDYLKNEYNIDPKDVMEGIGDGLQDQIFYRGGFVIKPNGDIYKGDELVFDPFNPEFDRVYAIDFAKMIISIEPGIHIPFAYILGITLRFSNYRPGHGDHDETQKPPGNEYINPEPGESEYDWRLNIGELIINPIDNPFYNELIVNNPYIEDKEPTRVELVPTKPLKDIMDLIGIPEDYYKEKIKDFVLSPKFNPDYDTLNGDVKGTATCTQNKVNYFWLMFLLMLGGGDYRKAPLPGENNQYAYAETKIKFLLCSNEKYQTGHPMMYSDENKMGLPISLLQIVYRILFPIFIILNIPPIRTLLPHNFKVYKWVIFKEWSILTIFPGLCIFGLIEHFIYWLQEYISEEIRDMFGCETEYMTPVVNEEGVGLNFLTSNNPICQYFNRNFKICLNDELDVNNRMKAGFYYCTSRDCPKYIEHTTLYESNKETQDVKFEDVFSEGSAINAIIKNIDEQENVSYDNRG